MIDTSGRIPTTQDSKLEILEVNEEFLCQNHPHTQPWSWTFLWNANFHFFFKEWEYQRQKLTWRHTAPGMGNLEEGRDSGSTIMIHQNTVYMSGP